MGEREDGPGDASVAFDTTPSEVEWGMLLPHAARGALFLLAADLDLAEVAAAVAADDAATIRSLVESGRMRRPDESEMEGDGAARFDFVIVQPFVLAQGPEQ